MSEMKARTILKDLPEDLGKDKLKALSGGEDDWVEEGDWGDEWGWDEDWDSGGDDWGAEEEWGGGEEWGEEDGGWGSTNSNPW